MNKLKQYSGLILLIVFFNFSAIFIWSNIYNTSITGDEPHYVILSSAIADYGTFEQTEAYTNEFENRSIYPPGLSKKPPEVNKNYGHASIGPHGLYSKHNIGLSLLLAPIYKLFSIDGIKVFLIFLSSLIIVLLWVVLAHFTSNKIDKTLVIFSSFFAFPFLTAANQIYPSMLSGTISLLSIVWIIYRYKINLQKRFTYDLLILIAVAYQPWLQIKYFAPSLISTIAIILDSLKCEKLSKKTIILLAPFLLSISLLALYNNYAFGNVYGPYSSDAMVINLTSLMVLLGLHLDQFQGVFLQNPIMFIGLLFLVPYFRWNLRIGILTLVLYASFVVPNAMHPAWYGGSSYAGRFAWASAVIFMLPTTFGLLKLKKINSMIFYIVILVSISLQIYFTMRLSTHDFSLYNKGTYILEAVETFYSPWNNYFPSFSNVEWAFKYGTNYVYIFFFLSIVYLGKYYDDDIYFNKLTKKYFTIVLITTILISVASSSEPPLFQNKFFLAKSLPSQTGEKQGNSITARKGTKKGYITFGPYIKLPSGKYKFDIAYVSSEANTTTVGTWDTVIQPSSGMRIIQKGYIYGTNGLEQHIVQYFVIQKEFSNKQVEIRNFYNGVGNLTIKTLMITRTE